MRQIPFLQFEGFVLGIFAALLAVFAEGAPVLAATQISSLFAPIAGELPAEGTRPPLPRYLSVQSTVEGDAAPATPSSLRLAFTVLTLKTGGQAKGATYVSGPTVWFTLETYPDAPIHFTAPVVGEAGQILRISLEVSLVFDRASGSLTGAEARFTPQVP